MKYFNHYAVIFIALIMSCSLIDGSSDDEKESKDKGCKLASISIVSNYDDGEGYTRSSQETYTLNYDGNVVDNILNSFHLSECSSGDCETTNEDIEFRFSYTGNMMSGLMVYVDGTIWVDGSNLTFVDGRVTRSIDEYEDDIDEYRFMYDNDGRLIKEENWDNYSGTTPGELVLYSYTEYVYTGTNLTSSKSYYNDFESGRIEAKNLKMEKSWMKQFYNARPDAMIVESETTYTYDDLMNPFSGNYALFFMDIPAPFINSENNPISETATYYWGDTPETWTNTYTYTFNETDYPSQLVVVGSNDQTTVDFTYDCE